MRLFYQYQTKNSTIFRKRYNTFTNLWSSRRYTILENSRMTHYALLMFFLLIALWVGMAPNSIFLDLHSLKIASYCEGIEVPESEKWGRMESRRHSLIITIHKDNTIKCNGKIVPSIKEYINERKEQDPQLILQLFIDKKCKMGTYFDFCRELDISVNQTGNMIPFSPMGGYVVMFMTNISYGI
ncbi:ExbD/TolR family protein [candidate division KSB1 bacterium]